MTAVIICIATKIEKLFTTRSRGRPMQENAAFHSVEKSRGINNGSNNRSVEHGEEREALDRKRFLHSYECQHGARVTWLCCECQQPSSKRAQGNILVVS